MKNIYYLLFIAFFLMACDNDNLVEEDLSKVNVVVNLSCIDEETGYPYEHTLKCSGKIGGVTGYYTIYLHSDVFHCYKDVFVSGEYTTFSFITQSSYVDPERDDEPHTVNIEIYKKDNSNKTIFSSYTVIDL